MTSACVAFLPESDVVDGMQVLRGCVSDMAEADCHKLQTLPQPRERKTSGGKCPRANVLTPKKEKIGIELLSQKLRLLTNDLPEGINYDQRYCLLRNHF